MNFERQKVLVSQRKKAVKITLLWYSNALVKFHLPFTTATHFHNFQNFVFYALFKSAAPKILCGSLVSEGLIQRRCGSVGSGSVDAHETYLIFHAQINAMKIHQLTRLNSTRRHRLSWHSTLWPHLHINCFWHRLFAKHFPLLSPENFAFFLVFHLLVMSSAYQPVGICPEKQLQSS